MENSLEVDSEGRGWPGAPLLISDILSVCSHSLPNRRYHHPHVTEEETEAQRGWGTCPQAHNGQVMV